MSEKIDGLYNRCITKIDDDIETAEVYLIGCVTLLRRRYTGRADRDRIREDFSLTRGLEKYERELNTISKLSDDALSSLIASSIDLTDDLRHVNDLFRKIKDATMDEREAIKQAAQARKASNLFQRIANILRPKKKKEKKKNKSIIGKNLFDGVW